MAAIRVAELNRLFDARYGAALPDDDAGREDAALMCHHIARCGKDPSQRIASWLSQRAPWMPPAARADLTNTVLANPLRWKADTLAVRLSLTADERTRLGIRTIGAIDQTAAERETIRQTTARQQKEASRRAAGAIPRGEYLGKSVQSQQPWVALGISRRTWYRRHHTGGTGPGAT